MSNCAAPAGIFLERAARPLAPGGLKEAAECPGVCETPVTRYAVGRGLWWRLWSGRPSGLAGSLRVVPQGPGPPARADNPRKAIRAGEMVATVRRGLSRA